jgi:hypothetical protein
MDGKRKGQRMKSIYESAEVATPALAKLAMEAHGGLDRWNRFTSHVF